MKKLIARKRKAETGEKIPGGSGVGFLRHDPEVLSHPRVVRSERSFLNMLEQAVNSSVVLLLLF